jgi:aspartate aminotransferase-like enzyme/ribosomal protein S18 acetylase RimI-like enzyme
VADNCSPTESGMGEGELVMALYNFRTVKTDKDLQQVYRLNYRTFVEEIPQHAANPHGMLVDRFDKENTYFIATHKRKVIGMVAARGNRPFSLDQKLEDLDSYLPEHGKLCEIRLLAIEKEYRSGQVFRGLLNELLRFAVANNYDLGVISGTDRQIKLYQNLGFIPFGPLVGKEGAYYQPMYLALSDFKSRLKRISAGTGSLGPPEDTLNFMPGPVNIAPEVIESHNSTAESHRSRNVMEKVRGIKQRISDLTGARSVEILLGSGTLANDAVAWQLKQLRQPGLVVSGGEFGERLVDHARRAGLDFKASSPGFASLSTFEGIVQFLSLEPQARWLWLVHCETSTGEMVNLPLLKRVCFNRGIKLCLDCISTFGILPIDLRDIYFATAVSGKGVGSFPGLAMVLYSHVLPDAENGIPRYLDLKLYADNAGVPFTHSSNLLSALSSALQAYPTGHDFQKLCHLSNWLRQELTTLDCEIITPVDNNSPAVLTLGLPDRVDSRHFGEQLAEEGCQLSFLSRYLLERNWVQICLMGKPDRSQLNKLLEKVRSPRFGLQHRPIMAFSE